MGWEKFLSNENSKQLVSAVKNWLDTGIEGERDCSSPISLRKDHTPTTLTKEMHAYLNLHVAI